MPADKTNAGDREQDEGEFNGGMRGSKDVSILQ
jgi:hypothetical protein